MREFARGLGVRGEGLWYPGRVWGVLILVTGFPWLLPIAHFTWDSLKGFLIPTDDAY